MMLVINGGLLFNVWLFMALDLRIFDTFTPAMEDKKFGQITMNFGDIFSDIFGGGSTSRASSRGADLSYNLEINLEEAVFGKSLNIEIPSNERCSGLWNRCSYCGGAGVIRQQQGFFSMQQTCPQCRGEGEVHDSNCSICNGAGYTTKNKKLSVKIPAGVDDGDRIRLSGEGELGRGGNRGDLYISINVKKHKIFERDG